MKRFSVARGGRRGAGIFGDIWEGLKTAHNFVKNNGLISKGAAMLGHPEIAAAAQQAGYGSRGRGAELQTLGSMGGDRATGNQGPSTDRGAQSGAQSHGGAMLAPMVSRGGAITPTVPTRGGGNRWVRHVKQHHAAHPHLSYKDAMREAKHSYRS